MLANAYLYGLMFLIVCGYGARKLGLWEPRSGQRKSLLWCSKMKCLSIVKTKIIQSATGPSETVTNCLLWPELKDCDQRCVK